MSLAEYLGTDLTASEPSEPPIAPDAIERALSLDGKEFALAVLSSREFKQYIVSSLQLGEIPGGVVIRLMDYAWGKPVDRVEHTGKDGQPMEITEVRRVIVRVEHEQVADDVAFNESMAAKPPERTH